LIRFLSSSLPKAAIEVAVCSKSSLGVIAVPFEKFLFTLSLLFLIGTENEALLQQIPHHPASVKISLL
jgi:hypothetical protein